MVQNSNVVALQGVHGTCAASAISIQKTGFNKGSVGRHGTGVYLWYATPANFEKAKKLARCWAIDAKTRGDYDGHYDKRPAALSCDIVTDEQSFVDLTDEDTRELFQDYVRDHSDILHDASYGNYKERAAKIADSFIQDLEEHTQVSISVVKTQTEAPKSYVGRSSVPGNWLGWNKATCLVVYNLSTIVSSSIKRVV
ncbi:TPA: hypothetical protein NJ968_000633 [Vibrio parahaemolyticus]|nr:hypothetical protein [Vibrio parahaemolyticus]HCG8049896.1 hypothetical protein [Vibrio parahaemolyticus]HCG8065306.1 hypothetical protein [Vibrio parahaemolyticus]HCH0774093.1 hypothetical protein [Vibrio parahaemolyticus]